MFTGGIMSVPGNLNLTGNQFLKLIQTEIEY